MRWSLKLSSISAVLGLYCLLSPTYCGSEATDPLDPFAKVPQILDDDALDNEKTTEQLVAEAEFLLEDEKLLEARSKLIKVLKKDPGSYRAHMLLSGYYMVHVGHFRLAFKYAEQAQKLFLEKEGNPPYSDTIKKLTHSQLLYLLTQARLNLDDYEGSLRILDEFTSYSYTSGWYAGTRAWVLMKLGRVEEAIKVARIGVLAGADPGRTLNMLGILLSMHGEREESIQIFREAISYELSRGQQGQPATPLNNTGEVFKETFDEERAESSWLRATAMPDGCEHVLPSLNLSLLYIDQLNLSGAKKAIDSFESCIAQYPLRNGEEHRALVSLARGRIALHAGNINTALELLMDAHNNRQWFGKIGTNAEDLEAAIYSSLAQAYRAQYNYLNTVIDSDIFAKITRYQRMAFSLGLNRWYLSKAQQVLTEKLSDFEDIYVRNTDSLLEYPTLGEIISGLSKYSLERRLKVEADKDNRRIASIYYEAFKAESELRNGSTEVGLSMISDLLQRARPKFDSLLRVHLLSLQAEFTAGQASSRRDIEDIYMLQHSAPRFRGLPLPVQVKGGDSEIADYLVQSGFEPDNSPQRLYSIDYSTNGSDHIVVFTPPESLGGKVRLQGTSVKEVIGRLADNVFSEEP